MKMLVYLCLISTLVILSNAVYKPKYIVPCSRSDHFNECAIRNAQHAVPFIVKGDKELKIPNLDPLKIDLVEMKGANNLVLKLKDIEVHGLSNVKILNVSVDFETQKARFITKMEKASVVGEYEMDGRIIIPITGKGAANITMLDAVYVFDSEWNLVTRDGKKYINVIKNSYDYDVRKITYDFKNLLKGGFLGDEMNRMLNNNWVEVNKSLKAPFLQTLMTFHNDISGKIFSRFPFDELFLD